MKGQIPTDKTIQMELLGDRLMSWLCSLDSLLSKKGARVVQTSPWPLFSKGEIYHGVKGQLKVSALSSHGIGRTDKVCAGEHHFYGANQPFWGVPEEQSSLGVNILSRLLIHSRSLRICNETCIYGFGRFVVIMLILFTQLHKGCICGKYTIIFCKNWIAVIFNFFFFLLLYH